MNALVHLRASLRDTPRLRGLRPFACGLLGLLVGPVGSALAGSSLDYFVELDRLTAAGGRAQSAAYANVAACEPIAGVSGGPAQIARQGFIAQLYEVTGLVLGSPSTGVGENATLQLDASLLYDDLSRTLLPAASVFWTVGAGPLSGISSSGLVTAAPVFQDSPATVQGQAAGFVGWLNLSVLNTHNDNFESYAGDGIDDQWQVQYFGLNQPNAAPSVDLNGTGQNNYFKFQAGLDPTLPAGAAKARFEVRVQPVIGQPAQRQIAFQPIVAGRNYRVQFTTTLATGGVWADLTGFTQLPDNGDLRTVIDNNASGAQRFYRVEIAKDPSPPGPTLVGGH